MTDYRTLFKLFFEAGKSMLHSGNYTVAAENFTKAIFVALDYMIEKKLGIPPANHEKRMELVGLSFREYLPVLKKAYKVHRLTYRRLLEKGTAEVMMKYAERLGKEAGFIE